MTCKENDLVTVRTSWSPEECAIASPDTILCALSFVAHHCAPSHLELQVEYEVGNSMFSASAVLTLGLASATIWSHSSGDKKLWYTYARGCFEICSALQVVKQVYEARLKLLCHTLWPLLTILMSALAPSVLRSVHKECR